MFETHEVAPPDPADLHFFLPARGCRGLERERDAPVAPCDDFLCLVGFPGLLAAPLLWALFVLLARLCALVDTGANEAVVAAVALRLASPLE